MKKIIIPILLIVILAITLSLIYFYRNEIWGPKIYKNTLNMVGDSKNFCERPRQFMVEDDGPSPYGFNLVIYEQHIDNITYCLEKNPNYISIEDDEGYTPLMMATYLENSNIVELFLKKGADVNQRNRFGQTALHIAASGGYIGIVNQLIKYGADVNPIDNFNQTPMKSAIIHLWDYPEDKYQTEEVINILKQHGGLSGLEEEKVQSPK